MSNGTSSDAALWERDERAFVAGQDYPFAENPHATRIPSVRAAARIQGPQRHNNVSLRTEPRTTPRRLQPP